jgi:hypothetical protein
VIYASIDHWEREACALGDVYKMCIEGSP